MKRKSPTQQFFVTSRNAAPSGRALRDEFHQYCLQNYNKLLRSVSAIKVCSAVHCCLLGLIFKPWWVSKMSHKRSLTRDLKILWRGRLRERNYQVMRARDQRILAGKRDSRRRSTTGFSENVVVTETSYQNVRSLSFSIGRGLNLLQWKYPCQLFGWTKKNYEAFLRIYKNTWS